MDNKSLLRSSVLIFCFLFIVLTSPVHAEDEDNVEPEWVKIDEFKLYWGEVNEIYNFSIRALEFSEPIKKYSNEDYVIVLVEDDQGNSWNGILSKNNPEKKNNITFKDRFELNVTKIVTGLNITSPYAEFEFFELEEEEKEDLEIRKDSWINSTVDFSVASGSSVHLDERLYIDIDIKNLKDIHFKDVEVVASHPSNFVYDPDKDISWDIELRPNQKYSISYSLRSLEPGDFILPSFELYLTHLGVTYKKVTEDIEITIYGPQIDIKKIVSETNVDVGDIIDIKLEVMNSGNRAANVNIEEQIPEFFELVNGETELNRVIQPEETDTLQYSVKITESGDLIIPATKAIATDTRGNKYNFYSERVRLESGKLNYYEASSKNQNSDDDIDDISQEKAHYDEKENNENGFFANLIENIRGWLSF